MNNKRLSLMDDSALEVAALRKENAVLNDKMAALTSTSISIAQIAARIEAVEASIECGDRIAMRKILRECVRQLRKIHGLYAGAKDKE